MTIKGSGDLPDCVDNIVAFEHDKTQAIPKIHQKVVLESGATIEVNEVGIDRFIELSEKNDNKKCETEND